MVAETEFICQQGISMLNVKYHLCVTQQHNVKVDVSPTSPPTSSLPIFAHAVSCPEIIKDSILETPAKMFLPNVHSGSYTDIGPRGSMDDEHIQIDDLACHLGFVSNYPMPSYLPERRRVEELGGFIDDGYLNGYLSVTRALGDWDLKFPLGAASPLIAEPDVQLVTLTEEDEFLIIACDGIWDVMSSQVAVSFVRRGLRRHSDPQQSARDLVKEALRLNTSDNLTAIVICLSPVEKFAESCPPQRRRFKACSIFEGARNRLKSLIEGN
uniref:PPM-type phosphatase domain-containing protein n=1 Tax=Medicago truncatula TaxID=3880 RepID=B7FHC0_MEDTR|nr:unknown [Medicago truncatula]AFK46224.1 unknown [Medicago truncatula]